jgi:hypothetical protein
MSTQDHPLAGDGPAAPPAASPLLLEEYAGPPPAGDRSAALLPDAIPHQPAPATGLADNNNAVSEQSVEKAAASAKDSKKRKRKQSKGKHRITKRGPKSAEEALAQMKAKA